MRALRAARRASPECRVCKAAGLPGLGLLGEARAVLRRSARGPAARRARPRGPRRESNGTRVHGRWLGRLPVWRALRDRLRVTGVGDFARRRLDAEGLLHFFRSPLRASREPANTGRIFAVPQLFGTRGRASSEAPHGSGPRTTRPELIPGRVAQPGQPDSQEGLAIRPRRAIPPSRRGPHPAVQLPPQPAEHADRPADKAHDDRSPAACQDCPRTAIGLPFCAETRKIKKSIQGATTCRWFSSILFWLG